MAAQQTGIYDEYLSVRRWTKWSLGVFPVDVIDLIKPLDWVGAEWSAYPLFWTVLGEHILSPQLGGQRQLLFIHLHSRMEHIVGSQ